ncbi:periplasmic beta-glucosidase/beta-xylosidase [Colletotrichum karsti]|uniref:beta-glucosidase n=1 Tax=Colletotrichum karsti TaxID=1095194 RepID=A0A9P6HUT6_9PEZI|nr:periplasmic beta-glucosidase/beta-xylosidase [Colletotrichum karsti]KAF9870470.1 periplasmic beta-glucosidase/beta-xylosidase [Colletotrichum karsti]
MTVEEKAGQMYHGRDIPGRGDETRGMVKDNLMTHFVYSGGISDTDAFIDWHNELQALALNSTRLGIPITISTDPQHGWTQDGGTSNVGLSFSRWTEPMGLAALRSPEMTFAYGDVVRQELSAVGVRQVLYPQVDLATEPRWGRTGLTMGEDANLTSTLLIEILRGFQKTEEVGIESIVATVKHFPGAGPMQDGEDAHFPWGKWQVYPGNNSEYHMVPFKAAISRGVPQIMPYYSLPKGTEWEETGFAFSKEVITGLLKEKLGFKGIVLTDFGILTMTPWGVEDKTELERTQLAIDAGCDIIGGESSTQLTIELVTSGAIKEDRINESVRKLLRQKFELGLFDKPFADKNLAKAVLAKEEFTRLGNETQRRSFTLLTNKNNLLPLPRAARRAKIYAEGIDKSVLEQRGLTLTDDPDNADYAFLRLASPRRQPDGSDLAAVLINNGTLEFNSTEQARQKEIYSAVPTIVDIKFNRPAAIPEVAEQAAALMGSYGSSHDAFLDVVFGIDGWAPEGKLPFDMPRSMKAVEESFEDLPFDTKDPLFRFGNGLQYDTKPCARRPHSMRS